MNYFGSAPEIGAYEYYEVGLAAPENISVAIANSIFKIVWSAVPGAVSYDIYTSDDPYGTFTFRANVVTTSWNTNMKLDKLSINRVFLNPIFLRLVDDISLGFFLRLGGSEAKIMNINPPSRIIDATKSQMILYLKKSAITPPMIDPVAEPIVPIEPKIPRFLPIT